MNFWEQNADAYAATRSDLQEPAVAMQSYVEWLRHSSRPARVRGISGRF